MEVHIKLWLSRIDVCASKTNNLSISLCSYSLISPIPGFLWKCNSFFQMKSFWKYVLCHLSDSFITIQRLILIQIWNLGREGGRKEGREGGRKMGKLTKCTSSKVCLEFACQSCRTQLEELEEDLNNWKEMLCPLLRWQFS